VSDDWGDGVKHVERWFDFVMAASLPGVGEFPRLSDGRVDPQLKLETKTLLHALYRVYSRILICFVCQLGIRES
jgi:hypothetical protein